MVGAIELKTMQAQLRHPQKRMTKPRILREIVAVQVKKMAPKKWGRTQKNGDGPQLMGYFSINWGPSPFF
jgi:hypothetical protein